jgi:hypothetical protein
MNGPTANWGHPVAYHPTLARFFGSVNAAIFFGQLRYWSTRTDNPLGVYKTSEEWTEETGLSYREQATARRILTDAAFVTETNKRLEHRIYFLIEWDAFNASFDKWQACNPRTTKTQLGESAKRISPNDENAFREEAKRRSSISTETTSEITSREGESAKALEVPPPLLKDFLKVREKKKSGPLTQTVIEGLEEDAQSAGITLEEAVKACCKYTWETFVPAWYAERTGTAPKASGHDKPDASAVPPVSKVWHQSAAGVTAKAAELGMKPRDEVMETAPAYKARVMAEVKKREAA